jgi:histidyl-tRNA synthetase
MNNLQKPRGTQDIYFQEAEKFNLIVDTSQAIARKHNFANIKTPTFEYSSLFERNIGEATDTVSKELYRFEDRSGRKIALRPEFTAGIVRAFCENSTLNSYPTTLRLFSHGQLFRYDRPKKGRYREFHQINFEFFNENNDISTIAIAIELLTNLKIIQKTKLLINYLGDAKKPYTDAVKEYFSSHYEELSEFSKTRIEENPLRILDSKEQEDIALLQNAPKITDFHSNDDKTHINQITTFLTENNINYTIDQNLVRGLDYYTGLVFEFIAPIAENGDSLAILGGGRYNNLVSQMGGKATKAIGFGGGIERLLLLLEDTPPVQKIFIINTLENFNSFALINNLASQFKNASFQELKLEKGKIGKTLQKLSQLANTFAVVIGEKEVSHKQASMKNLSSLEITSINI